MMATMQKSSLLQMGETTHTEYWNDSCSVRELEYGIANGAVGATTNPVIVLGVLKTEMPLWKDRIVEIIRDNPESSEVGIAWQLIQEMAVKGAELLRPVFDASGGKKGRISIQTNPQDYRNWNAMLDQAVRFYALAPNMQVKIPVTAAGIKSIEEAVYRGVSINATVCFTVSQSVAVAEAVERGLKRREKDGRDITQISAVCTIMVGRVDDWLKVISDQQNVITNPDYLEWAGVAVMKQAYKIYGQRKYRTKLLVAAYRNHYHWSEFIGADMVLTIPFKWAKRFNQSDITVEPRIDKPVDPVIVAELQRKFPDFAKAFQPEGLKLEQFDSYGATVRTLRSFISGYNDLLAVIRDFMLPNPDL